MSHRRLEMAELKNSLHNRVPGMRAYDGVARLPAETQTQPRVAPQAVERIQQSIHIASFIEQSGNAVVDQLRYLSRATRHHGEASGHVFVNLERREIKVRQFRIRCHRHVNRSEQRWNLIMGPRASEPGGVDNP